MKISKELKAAYDFAEQQFRLPDKKHRFGGDDFPKEAEKLLHDLRNHPHMFVLGCIMDRQITAEKAWLIPYSFGEQIGGFEFKQFYELDQKAVISTFKRISEHRFPNKMAPFFYSGIQRIQTQYDGDASLIWKNPRNPSSALVIRRFLQFEGVGVKIATMATNILARTFRVNMSDLSSIDVSPDRHVKKFFVHHQLIGPDASPTEIIYLARELNPEYPGIIDKFAFEWGRNQPKLAVRKAASIK